MSSPCQAPGHHSGGPIYGYVIRNDQRMPVCKQCFTGYQDGLGPDCGYTLERR